MSFSNLTKYKARFRQWGKCALCGESLDNIEEFAHHLWPESQGGPDKEDNCVILCGNCHYRVHNDGNYRSCIVAPLSYFPYANIHGGHKPTPSRATRTR